MTVPAARATRGRGPTRCPAARAAFDAVLLCLALEHVDEFETAIHEVARVLEPGGRFVLVLCHPLLQAPGSGWIDDRITGERYWRIREYLRDDTMIDEVAPGVSLRFIHRPLSRYVHAMGEAGLADRRHGGADAASPAAGGTVGLRRSDHDSPRSCSCARS